MAASNEAPLDESVFSDLYQLYNVMHGLHTNSVLHYFARSPYFDQTSNNAVLYTQSVMNPKLQVVLETREAMEARLRTMAGLEFIVAQEPAETAPGTGTGVWVIRKQTRKKRHGEEDEIAVLNTYFVVEGNVYMAPALSDILASRMVSICLFVRLTIANRSYLVVNPLPPQQICYLCRSTTRFQPRAWPYLHASNSHEEQDARVALRRSEQGKYPSP
jgi:mediator of RNA polymerase II transcription subunit 6